MDPVEFDRFAKEYDQVLRQTVAVTGEGPEFFHEYKIRVLALIAQKRGISVESILDFGSGVETRRNTFSNIFLRQDCQVPMSQSAASRLRMSGFRAPV